MAPLSTSDPDSVLRQWFQVLANRVFLSDRHALDPHNVRVEASSSADWWIQVQPPQYDRCRSCGFYATHEMPSRAEQELHLRELREALVIVTAYARLDYDSWLHVIKSFSGLRFSHDDILPIRYAFVVGEDPTPDGSYSCELFVNAFAKTTQSPSDVFITSYHHLQTRAAKVGASVASLFAPIPIRLEFSQLAASKHNVDPLVSMADTVTRMPQFNSEPSLCTSFNLECVELRLRRHELNTRALASVTRIVDTGVKIMFLELPGVLTAPMDDGELYSTWRSLSHKLFRRVKGHGEENYTPQIERLELPHIYFTSEDVSATWLPLLRTTTNIRSLTINCGTAASTNPLQLSSSSHAWVLLAYVMFSTDANNSVESLHLNGLSAVETETIAAFDVVSRSNTPFLDLSRIEQDTPRHLIDGLVDRENEQDLRLHASKLRRLVLTASNNQPVDNGVSTTSALVLSLLRASGASLSDLAIEGVHMKDSSLAKYLELCPSLQNLRLRDATLHSLDIFRHKLSSADLRSIRTTHEALHGFIKALQGGKTSRLNRLRIGDGWSGFMDTSTPQLLGDMLAANQSLSYLHVFRPSNPYAPTPNGPWTELKRHDGKSISSTDRPLAIESKLSFLASISWSPDLQPLNQDVLTMVFQFAAVPQRRTVVIESDRMSYMY